MTESSDRCCRQFSLTLEAVSLTFEPYLKMQKKQIFSLTLEPFSKTSLTLEVGQSFSLTLEPDSFSYKARCPTSGHQLADFGATAGWSLEVQ